MMRFRTADLAHVITYECGECGRPHLKIAPITGQRDDMLIVKGVSFSPKADRADVSRHSRQRQQLQ
jgi:phenylacetate-CoA ligase